MNSKQQGQGSDKSPSIGQGGGHDNQGQQGQSGKQDQQGGREAAQRKDFDKLMSESDQQLRDSEMKQGGGDASKGSGKPAR